jgi:hypothetical protein
MSRRRVFKTKDFAKFSAKAGLSDAALCQAVIEMEQGLIDADLGGGVVKKRVALPGRGKSSSSRTIVAHRKKSHWFFVYGFEKSDRANITDREKVALQKMATDLFAYSDTDLDDLVTGKNLLEICNDCQSKKGC